MPGTIYLIHFDEPYEHARHYLGYTDGNVADRVGAHEAGRGARLMEVVVAACVPWRLAATWPGTRTEERRMKNRGGAARVCPICRAERGLGEYCKKRAKLVK